MAIPDVRATPVNLERYHPRPGENQEMRYQLIGVVNGIDIQVPFANQQDAKHYATVRGWRVLEGLTLRS